MVRTLFLELLLFCGTVATPADGIVRMQLVENHRTVSTVTVRRINRYLARYTISRGDHRDHMNVRFIDNGLYRVKWSSGSVKVDVARYLINYAPKRNRQQIKDTRGRPVYLERVGRHLYVSSPTEKVTFIISEGPGASGRK